MIDAESLQGLRLGNAVLVPALVPVTLGAHLQPFILFDDTADRVGCPAPGRFVVVARVEHVALFRIVLAQTFPQVEQPLHVVAAFGHFPDLLRGHLKAGVVVKHLGPVLEIREGGAQEGGVVLADPETVYPHVTVLVPEDLPGLADVLGLLAAEGAVVGNRAAVNPSHNRLGQVVKVDGRPAPEVVRSPGGEGDVQGERRRRSLVGVQVAHALHLDQVLEGVLADLLGGGNAAVGQNVSEPSLPEADPLDHLDDGLIVAEPELQTVGLFVGHDAQLVEFHGPGDEAPDLQVVHPVLIHEMVRDQEGFRPRGVGLAAEGALGGVLRSFVVSAGPFAIPWNLVLGPAVYLAAEATGHVVRAAWFLSAISSRCSGSMSSEYSHWL